MSILKKRIKKIAIPILALSILFNVAHAQTTTASGTSGGTTSMPATDPCKGVTDPVQKYLCYIQLYTYGTLAAVNKLPDYISNWIDPDTSDATAIMQGSFSSINNDVLNILNTQTGLQTQLFGDLAGPRPTATIIYPNDITFQTLLGLLPDPNDARLNQKPPVDPAYNFLKNAAGINVIPQAPQSSWGGPSGAKAAYANYYAAAASVASFNSYVMSHAYADFKNGNTLSKDQLNLLNQVTNGATASDKTNVNWLTQVASENIGIVLRQILMFDSESYVLLTQLLQTQKQMLTAQVMTNTMLMLVSKQYEDIAVKKAAGTIK